ncbi:hypothetical protein MKX08_010114 [Trichoderma sp. CBMAI-0020]|nr:hypothetical protein MKX08_010114 [Trichoderma sp. CBMAI-0020]
MYLRQVQPRDHHYRSKDHAFRVSFSAPLDKNPPRLSREGYIRALEVYGREDILFGCLNSSVSRFNEWRKQNPGDLELYRRHANSLGYAWERGSVTDEGIYTSYVLATATGGPPAYDPNSPPPPEDSPVVKAIPMFLRDVPGNLRFVPGDDQGNARGVASLLHITLAILRGMVDDPEGIAAEDMADIKAMLNYVGKEDSERIVKGFQANLAPQGQGRFAMFRQNATLY